MKRNRSGKHMMELIRQLVNIPDAYDKFIFGIIAYAKQDPSNVEKLKNYMKENDGLTTSDVVKLVMEQPNFHEYSA